MTPRNERQVGYSMASGSYRQVYVVCPYYVTDNGRDRIVCEGLTPGGQNQTFYQKRQDYALQMELFCCGDYWRCEICAALDAKYREEEP